LVSVAVGLTAVAVTFAIADAILFRPPPFEGTERFVGFYREGLDDRVDLRIDGEELRIARDLQTSLEAFGLWTYTPMLWARDGTSERLSGVFVTPGVFEVSGWDLERGRAFREEDVVAGAEPVAIVSYELWQEEFGGREDAIGELMVVDGVPRSVVGVARADFSFPHGYDVWAPLQFELMTQLLSWARGGTAVGKLKPGVSVEQARAEFEAIARRIQDELGPDPGGAWTFNLYPRDFSWRTSEERLLRYGTPLALAVLVLVAGCVNAANLFLLDGLRRGKEFAIRRALGASRTSLVGDMVAHGFLVALAAGCIAAVVSQFALGPLWASIGAGGFPDWMRFKLDFRVTAALSLVACATAIAASLLPALRATRMPIQQQLTESTRAGTSRSTIAFGRFFVGLQVALSCGVLAAAGIAYASLNTARSDQLPFDADAVMAAQALVNGITHPAPEDRGRFFTELANETRQDARIAAAAATSRNLYRPPGAMRLRRADVAYESAEQGPAVYNIVITPGYFDALGVRLLQGRDFGPLDGFDSEPVCIVDENLAARHFGEASPMGRIVFVGDEARRVIGVAPDLRNEGFAPLEDDLGGATIYRPQSQVGYDQMTLIARPMGESPLLAVEAMRSAMKEARAPAGLFDERPWRLQIKEGLAMNAFMFRLALYCGIGALALSTIGVYSVISVATRQRKREFAIRAALGAAPAQLRALVVGQAARPVAIGLVIGLALELVIGRAMQATIAPFPPGLTKYLAPTVLSLAVAMLAVLPTALRAPSALPSLSIDQE